MAKQINKYHLQQMANKVKSYVDNRPAAAYQAGDGINIASNTISTDDMTEQDMTAICNEVFGSQSLPDTYGYDQIYSTSEQVVGKWIDGQPLYQRTWVKTTSPQQALAVDTWTAMALDGIPSGAVLRDGTMVNDGGAILPVAFGLTATGINYYSHAAYGWTRLNITIKYTKASS